MKICPEKFLYIRKNDDTSRKKFCIFGKNYDMSGKMFYYISAKTWYVRKKIFVSPENFLVLPLPPLANFFWGKY